MTISYSTALQRAIRQATSYRRRLVAGLHARLLHFLFATGLLYAAVSYSATVKNAKLDAIETTIGTAPELRVYNGTAPANADAALSGNTLLASGTLPSDWLAAASGGTKAKSGSWTLTGQSGAGAGTAGTFFRIYQSTTCHMQGTFTASGGGGDMTVDNNSIANGQSITVNTFTTTSGN